jgi:4-hydroxy-3-methylbut-2-enyl diphosphate reductase
MMTFAMPPRTAGCGAGIAADCDIIFIVGSANSSNSNRLREQAEKAGAMAYLIDCAADIRLEWLAGCARVGVSAGASAPEVLVQEVADRLEQLGAVVKSELRQIDEGWRLPCRPNCAWQVNAVRR